jgi:small-conductance mechanosensitive channel
MHDWINHELGQVPLPSIFLAFGTFFAVWAGFEVVFRLARRFVPRWIARVVRHERTLADDLLASTRRALFPIIALSVALQRIPMGAKQSQAVSMIVAFAVLFQLLGYANRLLEFFISHAAFGRRAAQRGSLIGSNLTVLAKVTLATVGILFVLDNFNINVSTFVAGLGVGGIAVALAAQAVLGDAFGSFTISLDHPFDIGDFIVFGETSGTVESVGLKTTRIRALSGEMVVVPNSDVTKARIQNFKKLVERRVVFNLKVAIDTRTAALAKIPELIAAAVTSTPNTRLDRAHLAAIDDWAFTFEVVWFALTPDYNKYMDRQQDIFLKILQALDAGGYELAVPVQRIAAGERRNSGDEAARGAADGKRSPVLRHTH